MTVDTFTLLPRRSALLILTKGGGTHTAANWYSFASEQSFSTSAMSVVGLSMVWSMYWLIFIYVVLEVRVILFDPSLFLVASDLATRLCKVSVRFLKNFIAAFFICDN